MTMIQSTATLRNLRISPRKVRLLIDLIRGLHVDEAMTQLSFSAKEAARPVRKLLASGIANAKHNHGADEKTLTIVKAFVDGGAMMYRYTPRAQGRATPVRHRTSHITLVLQGEGDATHRHDAHGSDDHSHSHDHEGHAHSEPLKKGVKKPAKKVGAKKAAPAKKVAAPRKKPST